MNMLLLCPCPGSRAQVLVDDEGRVSGVRVEVTRLQEAEGGLGRVAVATGGSGSGGSVCLCVRACARACVRACMRACVCVCMCACVRACVRMRVCVREREGRVRAAPQLG